MIFSRKFTLTNKTGERHNVELRKVLGRRERPSSLPLPPDQLEPRGGRPEVHRRAHGRGKTAAGQEGLNRG